MSFDVNGNYTLPGGTNATFGEKPVASSKWNAAFNDIAAALTQCLPRNAGSNAAMQRDLPMGGFRILGLALGLAASPALSFASDPGTGLWSPGAGQVAIANSGVQSLSISANRNVTIATPASGGTLTVNNIANQAAIFTTDGTTQGAWQSFGASGLSIGAFSNHQLQLLTNNTARVTVAAAGNVTINAPASGGAALTVNGTAGTTSTLVVNGGTGGAAGLYLAAPTTSQAYVFFGNAGGEKGRITVSDSGQIDFGNTVSATTRMSIGAVGNVTINAPASGRPLQVNNINGQLNVALIGRPSDGAAGIAFRNNADSSENGAIIGLNTGDLTFWSNAVLRMQLNAAGNISITQPTSGNALTASGANAGPGGGIQSFAIKAAGAFGGGIGLSDGGGNIFTGLWNQSGSFFIGTNATSEATAVVARLGISSAGNVTINAPSSGYALTVNGPGGGGINVTTNNAGGFTGLNLNQSDTSGSSNVNINMVHGSGTNCNVNLTNSGAVLSSNTTLVVATSAATNVVMRTNNVDRVTLGSAGNVTINAPSSGTALTVNGVASGIPLVVNVAASTNFGIDVLGGASSAARIRIAANGVVAGTSSFDIGQGWGSATDGIGWLLSRGADMVLATNASERMRISHGTGAVTISAPSSGTALTVNCAAAAGTAALFTTSFAGTVDYRFTNGNGAAGSATQLVVTNGASGSLFLAVENNAGLWYVSGNAGITAGVLQTGGSSRVYVDSTTFRPVGDNTITCGANGNRWSAVWAANGTIQTSDARDKEIEQIIVPELANAFVRSVARDGAALYRWIEGGRTPERPDAPSVSVPGKRLHAGFLAQVVERTYKDLGLRDFGGHVVDADGKHHLRYDQMIPMLYVALADALDRLGALEQRTH